MFKFAVTKKNKQTWVENMFNGSPDEIVVASKKDCSILFANKHSEKHMIETETGNCRDCFSPSFNNLCRKCPVMIGTGKTGAEKIVLSDKSGKEYEIYFAPVRWQDETGAVSIVVSDANDHYKTIANLTGLAYMDSLTGLPNRRSFIMDLEEIRNQMREQEITGFMAFMDLDNFKDVNDSYGHNTGDLMLKEFAQYSSEMIGESGKIYRLGGDEFAMLIYRARNGKNADYDEYSACIQKLIKKYTLPNIEMNCTVSMGVAFFPQHGDNFRELMRRADISVYKSKQDGRDRVTVFQEKLDVAKRFLDVFINMLPVLDVKGNTYGYQIVDSSQSDKSGDSNDICLHNYDTTIDAMGFEDAGSRNKFFISFNQRLFTPIVLQNLEYSNFVICIDGNKAAQEYVEQCKILNRHGGVLAIEDYDPEKCSKDLLSLATIIKIDIRKNPNADGLIKLHSSKTFIAADINTDELYQKAQKLGFQYFQGHYFRNSVVRQTKDISPLKMNYLRLLRIANSSRSGELDYKEVSEIIQTDMALSFKLLRLLNSFAVGLSNKITSINQALVYLGESELKKWISLLAIRGVSGEEPQEIMRTSLIRAKFGELIAQYIYPKENKDTIFLTGLFSLIDIALNKPFPDVFDELNVQQTIVDSLCTNKGPFSDLVAFFRNYEYGDWELIEAFAAKYGISTKAITTNYLDSISWYNELKKDLL